MNPLFLLLTSSVEFGFTVAIVGFSIVFVSLTLLVFVFQRLPKFLKIRFKKDRYQKKNMRKQMMMSTLWKET